MGEQPGGRRFVAELKRLEFLLEAESPLAHHEASYGNTAVIMRQRIRQRDGTFASVPIVTGDTMRHGLREAATYALLDIAGMLGETLSESALRLLFAGGMVTGGGGQSVRLDDYREMVDLVPTLALLGGCAMNRVIPGQMVVDPALLICEETKHVVPVWALEAAGALHSCRSHVEEVQRVRMDPLLDPGKQKLLLPAARKATECRLLASESASETGDAIAVESSKSSMMPRRYETVVQGSLFYWSVSARCYSALDLDSLMTMVGAFLREARVGGKRGTGHGRLRPLQARDVRIAPFRDRIDTLDIVTPDSRVGSLFRSHVEARAERLREFLGRVAA